MKRAALAVLLLSGAHAVVALGAEADARPELDFVPGRYLLIGRQPDSLATYTGEARIDRVGDRLLLTRVVAGQTRRIYGVVRRADPGEAYVLDFRWGQEEAMVCLVGADLDNYARLTCRWGKLGSSPRQPGMEAYFAQEP